MSRKPITNPDAQEFMYTMRGLPTDVVARAMTRACVNAVDFAGCSESMLANSWANACTTDRHRARFKVNTTLATLRADADAFLCARQSARRFEGAKKMTVRECMTDKIESLQADNDRLQAQVAELQRQRLDTGLVHRDVVDALVGALIAIRAECAAPIEAKPARGPDWVIVTVDAALAAVGRNTPTPHARP